MEIAFFSESPQQGKTPRNFTNMRTEYAWYNVLDSTHHPILDMPNIFKPSSITDSQSNVSSIFAVVSNPKQPWSNPLSFIM